MVSTYAGSLTALTLRSLTLLTPRSSRFNSVIVEEPIFRGQPQLIF